MAAGHTLRICLHHRETRHFVWWHASCCTDNFARKLVILPSIICDSKTIEIAIEIVGTYIPCANSRSDWNCVCGIACTAKPTSGACWKLKDFPSSKYEASKHAPLLDLHRHAACMCYCQHKTVNPSVYIVPGWYGDMCWLLHAHIPCRFWKGEYGALSELALESTVNFESIYLQLMSSLRG